MRHISLPVAFLLTFLACGKGIGPIPKDIGIIQGTLRFTGTWPDSTAEVRVAVYENYPPSNFVLELKGFSDPLPIGVDSTEYEVRITPGTYRWIIAVRLKVGGEWGPESFLGMYMDPADPSIPGAVTVGPGEEVRGVDFYADFSKMGQLPPEVVRAIESSTYAPVPGRGGVGAGRGIPGR